MKMQSEQFSHSHAKNHPYLARYSSCYADYLKRKQEVQDDFQIKVFYERMVTVFQGLYFEQITERRLRNLLVNVLFNPAKGWKKLQRTEVTPSRYSLQ